jgi:hypothetical protein
MANNRFKVDNGLVVTGNAEFYQRIDSFANAHFRNDLFVVSGNLVVNGTIVYANVVVGNGGIRSIADQQDLGNTTNRFNLFGYRVQVDDTLVPLANGVAAGNTTRRFEVFANNLNATTITIGAGGSINATYFSGTASNANTVGNLDANGIIVRTGTSTAVARMITTGTTGINITNGNGVSGNPTIDISFQSGLFANSTGVYVNASSVAVGTLPIGRGGTGGPDRATGLNNLLPTQNVAVADYVLRTDGTNASWVLATGPVGFSGSVGAIGFTGSIGAVGFTGSAGTNGTNGFTGSAGPQGFTGSVGASGGIGFTGSAGTNGSLGFTGSAGVGTTGFTGSAGTLGFTGSASTVIGFTGSRGFTGSASTDKGFTGSAGALGYTGSAGSSGGLGFTGSQGSAAAAAAPILRHVTSGFTGGGQVFVTGSTPTASAAGDIWIDTAGTSGYTQSLAANGWTKLPNGVILQWGTVTVTPNTTGSGTFPTSFTSVGRAVMNGVGDTGQFGQASKGATIYSVSTSGFSWFNGDETSHTGYWLAMGY